MVRSMFFKLIERASGEKMHLTGGDDENFSDKGQNQKIKSNHIHFMNSPSDNGEASPRQNTRGGY